MTGQTLNNVHTTTQKHVVNLDLVTAGDTVAVAPHLAAVAVVAAAPAAAAVSLRTAAMALLLAEALPEVAAAFVRQPHSSDAQCLVS